jgi:RNA polymerase sigma-70 factor (ECF subfamily)
MTRALLRRVLDSPSPNPVDPRQPIVSDDHEPFDYVTLRRDIAHVLARLGSNWTADRRDDLVQTALMRIMRIAQGRPPSGEGNRTVSMSYLYKVAYSVLVDQARQLNRRRETELDEEAIGLTASASDNPERTSASREIGRGIRECLRAMKRERRLAVTLHLQGHSVSDAARILAWTPKRTENLVYRGMADLRECLTAKGMRP